MWLLQTSFYHHIDTQQQNILVDDSGHAQITDFGLVTMTESLNPNQSPSAQRGHCLRWSAPEVLLEGKPNKEADIYSFAMVMVEVCYR